MLLVVPFALADRVLAPSYTLRLELLLLIYVRILAMSELVKSGGVRYESDELDPNAANKEGVLTGSIDPVYAKKAQILNDAIQDIGMGWYQ